jgi:hypothetical protein
MTTKQSTDEIEVNAPNKTPKVNCEIIFTFLDAEQWIAWVDLDLSSERSARRGIRAFLRKHKIKGDLVAVSMCVSATKADLEKNYNWYWRCNGKLAFGSWLW